MPSQTIIETTISLLLLSLLLLVSSLVLLLEYLFPIQAERDTPDVAAEEATPTPAKASKSKAPHAKEDPQAIRTRQDEAIARILPGVKELPELYAKVEHEIRKHCMGSKWTDTAIAKRFVGWCEFADNSHRPKLDTMLAAMAIHEYFGCKTSVFVREVAIRGLDEWANKEIQALAQAASAPKPTALEKVQKEPLVKTEPELRGDDAASTIRQSIETESGLAIAAGLKRPAQVHPAEPSNKRANQGSNQAIIAPEINTVAMLQHSQQRIVYRETGMQTDSYASVKEASGFMEKAAAAMQEQNQLLQHHNGMLSTLLERVQVAPARPVNSAAHQQLHFQAQDMITLQPVNRQAPAIYFDPNRDSGGHGPIFRFG
ncbi:hypothetical protein FLAG1_03431 [Fusarium langsethiae]|uniref:Uncharacterized protein n=1 Tax=Fusarium langsethiae TaxID=179993 RepID=A0A0N0DG88_FUSLA|nr:hypothetical protein FLAG1_03431 [Fusarium langsethiae]GKU01218.1 unnamed protein product [Fusarium langsethiae]GKU11035.1 unnamed protein product [Fusarium langsethiae]